MMVLSCNGLLVAYAFTIVLVSEVTPTLANAGQQDPPKVIVFQLGDDYGFNNVEYPHGPNNVGNPESRTPTMAKLAVEEGIRLERHYVFKYCSPTRSAFLSGRLPVHVNQNNDCNGASSMSGIDLRMTLLPQKLKQAGYRTAAVGKWHCGARSAGNLPVNRGFDYHLGFLKGGEDHYQQNHCAGGPDTTTIDLWQLESPAFGRNGVYSAFLYAKAAVQVVANFSTEVRDHDPSAKLFMYLPWHNTHTPLEAPDEYHYPPYPQYNNFSSRMTYNAMSRALDDGMANVTNAIRNAGFWNSTLIVFSADNGGWLLPGGIAGSSNFPLRGGKVSDFEGGVRAVAFISGGYLPASVRGSRFSGLISVADWYSTFCFLANVDATDIPTNTSVPATDSMNMWPSLLIPNGTQSPRNSILLSFCLTGTGCHTNDSALIVGAHKIVCGVQGGLGIHQWPGFPNGTMPPSDPGCPSCCLFNIDEDPTEAGDLRTTQPVLFANMSAQLQQQGATVYQTNYAEPNTNNCISNAQAKELYHGFIGPMCFNITPPLPPPPPPPIPFRLQRETDCLVNMNSSVVAVPCSSTHAQNTRWVEDESNNGFIALVTNNTATNSEVLYKYIKVDEHPTPSVTTKADFCIRGRVYLNPDAGSGHTLEHQGFLFNSTRGSIESTLCEGYHCLIVPTNETAAHSGKCSSEDGNWQKVYTMELSARLSQD